MSETADQMAPEASPGQVSKKSGVRRVNNLPMYLLGGVMVAFLVIMMLVAADRAAKQNAPATGAAEKAGNTSMFAKEIAGEQTGGMIQPASQLVPPELDAAPASEPLLIARPENLDAPPSPPAASGGLQQPERDDEADRIRMAKLQRLEEAAKARTGVQMVAPRSAASAPGGAAGTPQSRDEMLARLAAMRQQADGVRSEDPTAAYQARLAQIRSNLNTGATNPAAAGSEASQLVRTSTGGRNNITQFGKAGQGDRWAMESQPEAPHTPFELRAGFVVPATLISGINSDLPGQIMAQVAQHVYDTPTGRHLLIPQGSRLVGTYSSDVAHGQARVLVAWQRIVFPDGKAMDIGAMPGADSAGYAGFNDQVNNHYFRTFASAFLMSAVTAGFTLSQDNGNSTGDSQRASDALSEALGQQLGQVTAQMIAKNLNIAPTLEIRPGYRFNVIVTKDMTFSKPYQSFDY
ncbi:mating pair formation protein TrbI (plasmid) [Aromatoleum aromaticum EbN1]|uniref:Mating pair formation protein TrbI n=1 Tax=Aromatoleum aromaticum (strain DSM 19018 / LMG 30748 / EbN1) TaxID=76114 RepID=Q5NWL9_AROAE|nr:TrbI/VirB10 family protein [Aromatoleum aromaticum]CAI10545.1 mating pair formation protein TrbI [Aromatoleum aromaticum EbN1]